MGKRGVPKVKKPKVGQKLELPKQKQEIFEEPLPTQQVQWPPKLPPAKRLIGAGLFGLGKMAISVGGRDTLT